MELFLSLVVIGGVIFMIWALVRSGNRERNAEGEPEGFGGWLMLLAISIGLSVIVNLVTIFVITPVAIISLGLNIWLIYLMAERSQSFPKWFKIISALNLLMLFVGALMDGYFRQFIIASIVTVIWVSYLNVSVRVKNTFVQ